MSRVFTIILLFLCSAASFAAVPIRCAVDPYDAPFAFKTPAGEWTGYAVDLFAEIGNSMGTKCVYIEASSISEQLEMVKSGQADIAIGNVSVTARRESVLDFSHPYFITDLGALEKSRESTTWELTKKIAGDIGILLFLLVIVFYIVGFIAHILDKKKGIDSVHNGAWFALVTFATVGYGDYAPKTPIGKLFTAIWILLSLTLIGLYTGYISSVLTVNKLDGTVSVSSLYKERVASIKGSTSEEFLLDAKIKAVYKTTLQEAIDDLVKGDVDVVVYDQALLDYIIRDHVDHEVHNLDIRKEHYAFVLPQGSDRKETINSEMLRVLESRTGKMLVDKYFN